MVHLMNFGREIQCSNNIPEDFSSDCHYFSRLFMSPLHCVMQSHTCIYTTSHLHIPILSFTHLCPTLFLNASPSYVTNTTSPVSFKNAFVSILSYKFNFNITFLVILFVCDFVNGLIFISYAILYPLLINFS